MTNKEKYFDKASIDDMANILLELSGKNRGCGNCVLRDKYCDTKSGEDCITNIKNWLSREYQLTADEMFAELGYEKFIVNNIWISYIKDSDDIDYDRDIIEINESSLVYYKVAEKECRECIKKCGCGITEAEDKAIHKKIEELKNA